MKRLAFIALLGTVVLLLSPGLQAQRGMAGRGGGGGFRSGGMGGVRGAGPVSGFRGAPMGAPMGGFRGAPVGGFRGAPMGGFRGAPGVRTFAPAPRGTAGS